MANQTVRTKENESSSRITLSLVAERAGVSLATASLALNGRGRISLEVREQIQHIAAEMGYKARSKRSSRVIKHSDQTIAVLLDRRFFDVVDSYYFQILRGVQAEAERMDLQVAFSTVGAEHLKRGWESAVGVVDPAGMVLVGVSDPDFIDSLKNLPVPLVCVSAGVKASAEFDTVVSDDFQAMEQVFRHLTSLGHEKIAFIGGSLDQLASINRLRAFKIFSDEFTRSTHAEMIELAEESTAQAAGFETCSALLARHVDFTALVCMTDEMARGAMEALTWSGLRVPEDVSVVGFENKEISQLTVPQMTTVQINCHEMGKIACELLMLRVRDAHSMRPLHVLVAPELIIRASTAPVNSHGPAWQRSRYATPSLDAESHA